MKGPPPNPDLSADVRRDYDEARSILALSPRGSAALLRLAIQKMCTELGAKGNKIDDQIADLAAKQLPVQIQQALDAVRVIGNESVHPGQLDMRDDHDTAEQLFDLVNVIADDRISRPKQVAAVYAKLPADKRAAIEQRDAPKKALKRIREPIARRLTESPYHTVTVPRTCCDQPPAPILVRATRM